MASTPNFFFNGEHGTPLGNPSENGSFYGEHLGPWGFSGRSLRTATSERSKTWNAGCGRALGYLGGGPWENADLQRVGTSPAESVSKHG